MDGKTRNVLLDARVYMANERTILAWIRTGVALMGFGFVVARFGDFLREISAQTSSPPSRDFVIREK